MITEIWKDIEGYEGKYQVSNLGRVKSLSTTNLGLDGKTRTFKERILKQCTNKKNGYVYVMLNKKSKQSNKRVHILVANAFLKNPNNYPVVNHKNEIKTDNEVKNLEWCTQKQNVQLYHKNHKKDVLSKLNKLEGAKNDN